MRTKLDIYLFIEQNNTDLYLFNLRFDLLSLIS